MLLIVPHATLPDMQRAAKAGDERAIRDLASVEAAKGRVENEPDI